MAAFRLGRHHLLQPSRKKDLPAIVYDMGGAQAQLVSAAQLSFWARMRDLQLADVERAIDKKTLVKATCMRKTLFLLPARHLAMFVRGSTRRAEKEVQWARGKGVPERVLDAAIDAALGALDEPCTRPEIAERASRALGVRMSAVKGGGWGRQSKVAAVPVGHLVYPVVDFLHLAASRGVVCYGPRRGNEPTFVRADAWIPRWKDMPVEQAEGQLLRTYLRAFGPATPTDFSMWSGISLTGAREIWAREQAGFATVNVQGWEASVLRGDLDELEQAAFERPHVRLLPYFDSYMLGHREREHLMGVEHRGHVYRPQGWISPVVLVDGRAAAVWTHARDGDRLRVNVTKFIPLSRPVIAGLREQAQDLGRFLGAAKVDVRIN